MYLPKFKYKQGTAKVGEFLLDGEDYVGPYIKLYTGEVFAGSNLENLTDETLLTPISPEEAKRRAAIKKGPTQEDYRNGKMVRYFKLDKRFRGFTESSKEQCEKDRKDPKKTYLQYITASWIVTGGLEDQFFGEKRYRCKGVKSKNRDTTGSLQQEWPEIVNSFLQDPSEFVVENWKPGMDWRSGSLEKKD